MAGRTGTIRRGWLGQASNAGRPILGLHVDARSDGAAADRLAGPRTVRRALADAGRKATEVSVLVCSEALAADDARAFARTALGPTGVSVELVVARDGRAFIEALSVPEDIVVTVDAPGGTPSALVLGPSDPASAGQAGEAAGEAPQSSVK